MLTSIAQAASALPAMGGSGPQTSASNTSIPAVSGLRVDLTLATPAVPMPFITLDRLTGSSANVSLMWQLAPGTAQSAYSITVTSRAGVTAWASGNVTGSAQSAYFARTLLAAATGYTWTVSVLTASPGSSGSSWVVSAPSPFFTGAAAEHWAASVPIWAPTADGSCGPTPSGATPSFARFQSNVSLPAGPAIESALLFITGAPPVYKDPWNTTKILGGYALRLGPGNGGPLRGVGPGRTACGPYAQGPCAPVQPFEGYDLTTDAVAAQAQGTPLALHVEGYGVPQPQLGIAPAVQAVLVVRFVGGSPAPLVLGTSTTSSSWLALNGDAIRNPGANKAGRWYVQPEEQVNTACQVLPGDVAPAGCCSWTSPIVASNAWAAGTVPLAGKTTQPLQVLTGQLPAGIVQLGPGWWVADMGGEHQGGIELRLQPSAAPGGAVPACLILVQMGEELATNGSVLWNMRTGNNYRDRWHFPAATAATPGQFLYASHHEYSEFRWAEIVVLDSTTGAPLDVPLEAITITGWTVRYPYDDNSAATLSTSSPDLNAVWKLASTTLKVTTLDFIADSNTRQRSPDCMADDTTAILSFYATTSEMALPRMVASQIMSFGPVGYISGDWADWTVLPALNIVYDAWVTGDTTLAMPLLQALAQNHTYTYLVDAASGLVHNQGLGALVDTSGGSDDGFRSSPWNAVVQAWAYAGMTGVASLAESLGQQALASQLTNAAAALKAGFNSAFFNGTAICDGLCSDVPHTAVHSSFYALAFGLVNDTNMPAVWGYVRERAFADPLGVPCGSYPVQFLLQGLYANTSDHGRAAYGVLTSTAPHSWLNMMAEWDATATMECWLPTELPNLSFSHVWSSSPSFIVPSYFFGLQLLAPGASAISVRPQPGPVLDGQATLPTLRGPVTIAFRQTMPGTSGGCFLLQTTTPGGVTLRAYVPLWGKAPSTVTVTVDGAPSQVQPVQEGDYLYVDGLPSGSHTVTTC